MFELILWIVFGGIAGWIASIIMGTNQQQGMLANIVVGIIGAVIGGYISSMLGGPDVTGFNLVSLCIAVLGAVILLAVLRLFTRGQKN